jgi:hypothetical protein
MRDAFRRRAETTNPVPAAIKPLAAIARAEVCAPVVAKVLSTLGAGRVTVVPRTVTVVVGAVVDVVVGADVVVTGNVVVVVVVVVGADVVVVVGPDVVVV